MVTLDPRAATWNTPDAIEMGFAEIISPPGDVVRVPYCPHQHPVANVLSSVEFFYYSFGNP
jgi:hypothetical protein